MEILAIGKPAINIYLPLQEFPEEGDVFSIENKNESLGNVAAVSACLLAKWKINSHFTGVVGNDGYAEKINETFKTYGVDTHYVETNFDVGTATNTMILNAKTGVVTKVLFNNPKAQLQKYRYDFQPDLVIMDGTDLAGTNAMLNNNQSIKKIFYARRGDADTLNISKRCDQVICTQNFAEVITKEQPNGTPEGYVDFYQKIVDKCGSSNYIVILNDHKILYSLDGKVKLLPEMKINNADASSFDSIFTGTFSFAYANGVAIDDAIKLANTAAGISLSKIGEEPSIPSLDEVLDNSGLRDKLGMSNTRADGGVPQTQAPVAEQPVQTQVPEMPAQKPVETVAPVDVQPMSTPQVQEVAQPQVQSVPVQQTSYVQPTTVNQAFNTQPASDGNGQIL